MADPLQLTRDAISRADPEEALQVLDGCDAVDATVLRGQCLRELGRVEAAVRSFEAALEQRPNDAEVVGELALTWLELGHEDNATSVWTVAFERSPDDAGLYRAQGLVLTRLGRHGDAIAPLLRATELDPSSCEASLDLASARFRVGQFADAYEDYERALVGIEDVQRRIALLKCQAMCRVEEGRHREAADVLRGVLETAPDDLSAAFHLGLTLDEAGDHEDALAFFEQVAAVAETQESARQLGGQALFAKAKTCFMRLHDHPRGLDAIDALVALAGQTGVDAARQLAQELTRAGLEEAAAVVAEECDVVESML